MSADFIKKAKSADDQTKNLLFGFVRSIHSNMPDLIIYIALCYYYEDEVWDKTMCGPDYKIINNTLGF